ncbi:MAG: TrkA family potassium uptake protein [Acidimicrobiales bacterium]
MADIRQLTDRFRSATGSDRRTVMVIGLGRFGSALARELVEMGHEVLGVDVDDHLVGRHKDVLTEVRTADCTETATLTALGAPDIRHAVVGIGNDMEASILTTAALSEVGVDDIWAKAQTDPHRQILERVGADHVVLPEAETGRRVAHLVTGTALSYVAVEKNFVIIEVAVPRTLIGKPLSESQPRKTFGITVIAIRRPGGPYAHAQPEVVVRSGDIILAAGQRADVETFTDRS